jgi:hypothetical protein
MKHLTEAQLAAILTLADKAHDEGKPKSPDDDRDLSEQDFADALAPHPFYEALKEFLKLLPEAALREVAGLMWFGRGDFESLEDANRHFVYRPEDDEAVRYIAGKSPLAKYLRAGLDRLQRPTNDAIQEDEDA